MTTKTQMPKPALKRGERVVVTEEGIAPWFGAVNAVKPSKESGWWVDVDRDGVGVWSICLENGTVVEKLAEEGTDVGSAHLADVQGDDVDRDASDGARGVGISDAAGVLPPDAHPA